MNKKQQASTQALAFASYFQLNIHLIAYIAVFWRLIINQRGGYYSIGTIAFVGMSVISLPFFLVTILLIKRLLKLSSTWRVWAYFFNFIVFVWSVFIIQVAYFM
ncbi:MAG: hypothetical protein DCF19_12540 [Pseudanabaena frigida]|uniref:Uncharacterized protein n=1 Tax=Pseudanabaena frigida TaxID=945775 RepID=A0A2W4W4M3_9CYAN|nr:MAG: hypothetical protein DCF19_12540 [Pseudanabaena frigida]